MCFLFFLSFFLFFFFLFFLTSLREACSLLVRTKADSSSGRRIAVIGLHQEDVLCTVEEFPLSTSGVLCNHKK